MKKYEYHDVHMRGTIERVVYMTTNRENEPREKYANVYLPYGYNAENAEKRYNILYVMHGGGGNPDAWLDCCKIKNMLDYMIDAKEIEPLIVVFPSFYKEKISRIGKPVSEVERDHVIFFQKELVQELLPAVEKKYHTYAQDITYEALKASRRHRGFSGFSMGSCTTWFTFINYLDLFSVFVPLSGDCWAVECLGGERKTTETVDALVDAVVKSGYGIGDYTIFTAAGTKDPAGNMLTPQVEEMKKRKNIFVYDDNFSKGNFHYILAEGEVHAYEAVCNYLYNYLPYLFD